MVTTPHLQFIAILYFIFSIVAAISIIISIKKTRKISIMHMCTTMYIVILCTVPALIIIEYLNNPSAHISAQFSQNATWTFYCQLLLTAVGYFFLHFGYAIKTKPRPPKSISSQQTILPITVLFTVISVIALYLWASGFGGVTGLLKYANEIRAGWVTSSNSFAFFKHFVPLSLLSSWLIFNAFVKKELTTLSHHFFALVLMLINTVLSIIYIQANDGRMLLAVYIFLFFVIYLKHLYEVKKRNILPILIKLGISLLIILPILFNADAILQAMRGKTQVSANESSILTTLSREFSFVISGTQKAATENASGNFQFMIGNDLINGLFAWLPTSLKPIILEDVWNYNTRLLNSGVYGQSPTTIVAQSIYDLSWIGIFIIPFFYGLIIKKIESILEQYNQNTFYNTVYIALGYYLCKGLPYFSFYNIMMNTFFIFIAILIYATIQRIKL